MHPKLQFLHPVLVSKAVALHDALVAAYEARETQTLFEPFEGYRSPERQAKVLAARASEAGPWQSAHQFGLAVDFAARVEAEGGRLIWSWNDEHDWPLIKRLAPKFGLHVPITWDRGHVEHPIWRSWKTWMAA